MKETAAGVMGVRFLAVGPSLGNEAADLLTQYQGAFVQAGGYCLAGLEFRLALLRDKRLNMRSLLANAKGFSPSRVNQSRTDNASTFSEARP